MVMASDNCKIYAVTLNVESKKTKPRDAHY